MEIKYICYKENYGLEILPKLKIPQTRMYEEKKYTVAAITTEKLQGIIQKVNHFFKVLFNFILFKSSTHELKEAFKGKK